VLNRLSEITVTRDEVRRLAVKDQCTLRILREIKEAQALIPPSRLEIEAQKKVVAMAYQELHRLQSVKERKKATLSTLYGQLHQRLTIVREKEEARKVRVIRGHLAPQFLAAADAVLRTGSGPIKK
jgi:hypothetical protein